MSSDPDRADARGVALVFGAAAALGTLGVISGLAYREGMPAAVFTALRAALGALILGVLVVARWQPRVGLRSLAARERRMLAIAIVANGAMNLLLFAAFSAMAVAIVMTLFYTYPVLVMMAMGAMGLERITPLRLAALALAMGGLVLVVGSQVGPEAHVTLAGVGLALAAAVCQAAYLVVSRDGYRSVPAVQATSLILLGGMLISGTAALLTGGFASVADWATEPIVWVAVLLAGTIGAAIPKVLVLLGVRRIGGTRTAMVMLVEPVVAVVAAALVLGQPVTIIEVLGGGAILLAAALAQRPTVGDARSLNGPEPAAAIASHE
jgi:drug/metabolite transporter (DMT)-like permease